LSKCGQRQKDDKQHDAGGGNQFFHQIPPEICSMKSYDANNDAPYSRRGCAASK
jgi:hypothetical protein